MTTITFDTHSAIKRLKAAGFDEQQAEALSDTIRQAQDAKLDELATKGDILRLEGDIFRLERDLKELELRMVIKLGAMILAAVGMMVTANRLWPIPVQYVSPGIAHEVPLSVVPKPASPVVSPSH
ncbi:MAG: DUF1640 domain-containing protein [Magnetococcales bacterium]|nr:DUF1640 domain-containing protein [Magnetococcales bacterium]MBF0149842.1 DUF1640 domain-containing protein [Magnetococcales bacterium]MBF0174595.1 DUF1640 domain-containing protein [Magnetococcales bacterium]MBF0346580.1 DUF1640 domain-containing protein [Magnetococcales bacterium]MBF0631138.1 DUF1640 domain-containing protein [Magnetococcales bacterium]